MIGINNAVEYCNPTADACSLSYTWPSATYDWSLDGMIFTITDQGGGQTRYTHVSENLGIHITGVKDASSSSRNTKTYRYADAYYCTGGLTGDCTITRRNLVAEVNIGSATWNYNYQDAGPYSYESSSSGSNGYMSIFYARDTGYLTWVDHPYGWRANYSNDIINRIVSIVYPGGLSVFYTYDTRGNVTERKSVAEPSSGLADIITTAGYDATCSNPVKCNQPNWTRDGRVQQTDFDYFPSGLLKSVTKPADASGVRPQTRYLYEQRYAWVKSSSGSFVRSASPIWMLARESFCKTGAASGDGCAVAGDQVVTAYEYGPDSGPNNLFLRGVVATADGQSLRTCYGYDNYGNKISETAPKASLAVCP